MFDSTGEYETELRPVVKFAEFLKDECDSIFSANYSILTSSTPVQRDKNSCGVYSLFYIYCRVLGAEPATIVKTLQNSKSDYIQMFKEVMFG